MNFKQNLLAQTAAFLIVFAGFALGFNWSSQVVLHLAATLGFALILYWFFSLISSKHKNIWDTVITALIIFLVVHYGTGAVGLVYPLIATFFAMVIKFFIEYKNSPVVNPAAGAILLMALVTSFIPNIEAANVSWWGASYQGWVSLALILAWIVFGLWSWRKYALLFSFLIGNLVMMFLIGSDPEFIRFVYTDSTLYFLAAIMLVEPKTSPFKPSKQVIVGILASVFYTLCIVYKIPYFGLFTIVAANLVNVLMVALSLPKKINS